MFEIHVEGDVIRLCGRLDAAAAPEAETVLSRLTKSAVIDFSDLDYISSAGLGKLFAAHKVLMRKGEGLKLTHLNAHIQEVFEIAGFDLIFEIE